MHENPWTWTSSSAMTINHSKDGSRRSGTPLPRQIRTHAPPSDSPSTPSPKRSSFMKLHVASLASSLDKPFRKVVRFVESPTRGIKAVVDYIEEPRNFTSRGSLAANLAPLVLQEIFLLLARDQSQLTRLPKWNWTVVTHVCSHWRSAAMEYSELWSYITNFRSREMTQMFLTLSRSADLTIRYRDIGSYFPSDLNSLYLALDHFPRIRDLELEALLDCPSGPLWYLGAPNPWLRRLALSVPPTYMMEHNSSLPLPRGAWFLLAPVKHLQAFSLSGYHCDWRAPVFQNLSELSLSCIPEDHYRPDIAELLDILRRCPGLESLKLDAAGPEDLHIDPGPPVSLPWLRVLEILGIETGACAKLMGLLNFPEATRWAISCRTHTHWMPVVVVPQLTKTSAMCDHLYILVAEKTLRIGAKYLTNADIERGFTNVDTCSLSTLTFYWQEFLHLLVPGFDPFTVANTIIGESFWRTARAMTISLYTGTEMTEAAWTTILQAVPNLRNLEVFLPAPNATLGYSITCESLVSALTPHFTQDDRRCVNLASLKIHNANFFEDGSLLRKLKLCLKSRLNYGMMLKRLYLIKPYGRNLSRIHECSACVDELIKEDDYDQRHRRKTHESD